MNKWRNGEKSEMQVLESLLRGIAVSSASQVVARVINNLCASINKLLPFGPLFHPPDILSFSRTVFNLKNILENTNNTTGKQK